jgi:hypothetical protein
MSRYNAKTLYELLPAVYRQRDLEHGQPIRDLLEVVGRQAEVLEEEIHRLYENWFIETCDEWVVPYLGDLLGVRPTSATRVSTRAEVANTIGYRRRKGTLAVVEQLARDVTGWPARAVEYFTLLSTNQNLNHPRMESHSTPDLRDEATLSRIGGPFERTAHLVEVRRIARGTGRYNIPNIGVHLWRLSAHELDRASAHEVDDGTGLHYTFSPLGNDTQLFCRPQDIDSPFDTATERHVPDPLRRRVLHERLEEFYGEGSSLAVWDGQDFIAPEQVAVCDLTDWAHAVRTGTTIAIDPVLGRIAFADEPASEVRVRYHYGFSADIGGGTYDRSAASGGFEAAALHVAADASQATPEGVERFATVGEALARWASMPHDERPQVIQIDDNSTYRETLADLELPQNATLTIRAANRKRPTLLLADELTVVSGEEGDLELSGLLIGGHGMRVTGRLRALRITDCTLVPGRRLSEQGRPLEPGTASLIMEATTATVDIQNSIVGPLRTAIDAQVRIWDSIIDANDATTPAHEGLQDGETGGVLEIQRATVMGVVRATEVRLASDTLFLGVVEAVKRQEGCLRFSHVPVESIVPRRFHCQPASLEGASPSQLARLALAVRPRFTSVRYGDPGYCQLTPSAPPQIRRGGEDESEMGAFSRLKQPQREDSLRVRLHEYLRLGMEAGILYET